MRHQNRRFTRKTISFSKQDYWMERQLHLSLGYYHFCWVHAGSRQQITPPLPTKGSGSPKKWRQVPPAMASGVTDHRWIREELSTFRVPPPINSTVKGHWAKRVTALNLSDSSFPETEFRIQSGNSGAGLRVNYMGLTF